MHSFTHNPRLALPRASDDQVEEAAIHDSESQVLDVDTTALPGALEVYLIRATDIVQVGDTFAPNQQVMPYICTVRGVRSAPLLSSQGRNIRPARTSLRPRARRTLAMPKSDRFIQLSKIQARCNYPGRTVVQRLVIVSREGFVQHLRQTRDKVLHALIRVIGLTVVLRLASANMV